LQHKLDYPQARNQLGVALRGYANSMLDISDGLAQDLGHILKASQVGAVLQLEKLFFSTELQQLDVQTRFEYALAGGDDYELCFTISPQQLTRFYEQYGTAFQFHVIGEIVAEPGLVLQYNQVPIELKNKGYQHFD
jgi:thiamine-monophosphate kinase